MVISKIPRNNQAADKFSKELLFLSYLAHKTVEYGTPDNYCITKHTKIAVNYSHDWPPSKNFIPNIQKKPNPFGIVAAIKENPWGRPINIYDLGEIAEHQGLWRIQDRGNFKQVIMLSDSDVLRQKLSKPDPDSGFECEFSPSQFGLADILAHLYSKFSTEELNILASHRYVRDSLDCIQYEFKLWETNFQTFWSNIPWAEGLTPENIDAMCKMAIACEQIEIKTDYIFNKIHAVVSKLETLHDLNEFEKYDKTVIQEIIQNTKRNSKLTTDNEPLFLESYTFNREYLYPLTLAVYNIGLVLQERGSDAGLKNRQEIDRMVFHLNKEPCVKTNIDQKLINPTEFQSLIDQVTSIHAKAKERNKSQLISFTNNHPIPKDWDITDGRI